MTNFTPAEMVRTLLDKYGTGFRPKDDTFFVEGNFYLRKFVKLGVLSDITKGDDPQLEETNIVCNVPDCQYTCGTVQDYESHYNSMHRYSCGECKKTLPNAHLLDLHLSESHDSYFAAQVQSGKRPMFSCFLEECPNESQTPDERRDHCIKQHKFPHNFRFDQRISSQKKHSTRRTSLSESSAGVEMELEPVESHSGLGAKGKKNFNFGHSKVRSFKLGKLATKKTDILESNRMVVDLLESLPTD
ncbi:protein lethal(2)k10201 [Ochlerotatus camptorhynchus]|uniref:protein lethal(2)k10201 n=1 Tax=Ochlerotatus camptorhynchus TaxID=644619 RepID=UPI0031D6486D